jgi:hypothetical protein
MIKKKAQSWSIDITLAVIVFVSAFLLFYATIGGDSSSRIAQLKDEALTIIEQLVSDESPLDVATVNEINESRLIELKNLTYEELKRRFRVEGDFCIYLEDSDGYFILINNSYRGIGAPTINLSKTPCSQN